ncbi:STAS domain-containing protein [Amycolatopsis nigrescens]|uniref:STAS domain-containing protein n=1 Tax=Amycolatopsis nigrescens TaxID=381445 RepID=UPI00037D038C|nr:STAS domain-containing protein [Amycolatopsis nigrescens]
MGQPGTLDLVMTRPSDDPVGSPVDGVTTISVSGDLDLRTAPEFAAVLAEAQSPPPPEALVLELGGIGFCASAGLQVLLRAQQRAEADGTRLFLVGAPRAVLRPLQLTGLDRAFVRCDTTAEALAGCH